MFKIFLRFHFYMFMNLLWINEICNIILCFSFELCPKMRKTLPDTTTPYIEYKDSGGTSQEFCLNNAKIRCLSCDVNSMFIYSLTTATRGHHTVQQLCNVFNSSFHDQLWKEENRLESTCMSIYIHTYHLCTTNTDFYGTFPYIFLFHFLLLHPST